ncbi:hypothetical protein [Microbaculum marinum]|uniref:Uncharacterized protein n=1 Tax=Microbaculum marinum TaxID=1764581 RepID=A0AAW9RTG4_9HYPH
MSFRGLGAAAAGAVVVALMLCPDGPALAHTSQRAFVLLLPTGYYMTAGALAVGATFLLLAFMPKGISDRIAKARLRLFSVAPPTPVPTSLLAFLFLAFLVAVGIWGNRDPLENPLPLTIWTLWWIVFTILTAVFGNLWVYLNPWSGPARLLLAALGRSSAAPPLTYPKRLGFAPAILLFLAFALFEQVDIAPADPERLAIAVAAYWLVNFGAVLLFGEKAWFRYGEPFGIFFRFVSRLSPLVWEPDAGQTGRRRLSLAMPGAALLDRPPLPLSGTVFVLLTLTLETFDGLSDTFWWMGVNDINPLEFPGRSAVVWINTVGLLASWAVLTAAYVATVGLGWLIAGRPGSLAALLGSLVFSIMPIALAFHFSHYLTVVLVDLQYAYAAASDPLGTGANLLGLQDFRVTTSFLNTHEGTKAIWNAQTAGIVVGHILGILLAHEIACRLIGDYRAAVVSQAPLALVMVAYTLFGLWLLSTPVAG